MLRSMVGLLPLATLVLTACNEPRPTPAGRDTGVSQAVDKQAEERTIRSQEQRWREALTAKDSATIAGLYAEDGYYLPQESDGYESPGPVSARWLGERNGGLTELEREPKRIEVADAGDMNSSPGGAMKPGNDLGRAGLLLSVGCVSHCVSQ